MYASQPTIDPQDDRRVYMLNSYSFSDNGGETFTTPNTTTHGDDRFVWVNPRDSRHVIKLDDGGIGISFDRGLKFLYVQNIPVSQYYRVAVDNERPYNIYGGLQDNGCWKGPSAVWTANGILNEHWSRLCGGDGFFSVPDPANSRHVFSASQFLGLQRNDTRTWTTQDIRPGDPQGAISDRRNWNTWGKNVPQQVLGNEWHYANWDAPVVLSPFDPATVYAGGKHLFRSRDRGMTWEDLGDMTTGVDRSTLPVMGKLPDENILSVDDGVPFYPGLVAIAPSPVQKGLIYVGTDDGRLRMSVDDGKTWTDLQDRLPGAPKSSWFGGIEASRHNASTVYVAMDNHRSNDFNNWIYKSTDGGKTFTAIAGDMPANRVVRTIREDVKNPNLLFAATEIGLFFSPNGGTNWIELKNNMPTLPFNDLVIHPRDNDLVLGIARPRHLGARQDQRAAGADAASDRVAGAFVHGCARVPNPADQPEGAHRRHVVPRREPGQRRADRLLDRQPRRGADRHGAHLRRPAREHAARHRQSRHQSHRLEPARSRPADSRRRWWRRR